MANADKTKPGSDHILSREERIREIQSFNLLSDVFMSVALRDIPACQHILRILTGFDDLKVKDVRTQYAISQIKTHSVRLDVLAETGNISVRTISGIAGKPSTRWTRRWGTRGFCMMTENISFS